MTTAQMVEVKGSVSSGNYAEIAKFLTVSLIWLSITFGAVWLVAWLVGVLLPWAIEQAGILGWAGLTPGGQVAKTVADSIRALTPLIAVMVFIPINATFMVLFERRGLALFTVRKGPNRVGPDGFLQTAADAVKLLFKENINPHGADILMFTLAPIIFFAPSIFAALPLLAAVTNHALFQIVNVHTGIFYVLAMSSIPVVGIVMGGWASNNKYSLVGGLRSAAQAISYEIPLVLAVVTTCYFAGTLNVVQIAQQQGHGIWRWNFFAGGMGAYGDIPGGAVLEHAHNFGGWIAAVAMVICMMLLCGLYMIGACAEINRIPFDLPEAESELVSGYNTEYSGIRFAIFFLAEFTNLFIVSTIAVVMWFGGGHSPFGMHVAGFELQIFDAVARIINGALGAVKLPAFMEPSVAQGAFWALTKTYLLVFFAILIRGTLPRFRIDQLMDFGWKRLIPLSLILLLLVTFLKGAL